MDRAKIIVEMQSTLQKYRSQLEVLLKQIPQDQATKLDNNLSQAEHSFSKYKQLVENPTRGLTEVQRKLLTASKEKTSAIQQKLSQGVPILANEKPIAEALQIVESTHANRVQARENYHQHFSQFLIDWEKITHTKGLAKLGQFAASSVPSVTQSPSSANPAI